jgi:hypothetical protein
MLDTNVFNGLIDGLVQVEQFDGKRLFATHVQFDELSDTPDAVRREKLQSKFSAVVDQRVPTESAVWGISRWGQANWPPRKDDYEPLLARIRELDRLAKKKKKKENQSRDALIAVTAIKAGYVLVTSDQNLATATKEFGGAVIMPA